MVQRLHTLSSAIFYCTVMYKFLISLFQDKQPYNLDCHEKRAEFYRRRGSPQMASYDYDAILRVDPTRANVWINLVESYIQMNDHVKARAGENENHLHFSIMNS